MIVLSSEALKAILDAATGRVPAPQWTLHLYADEDGRVEIVGGGYAALPLTPGAWVTTESPLESAHPPVDFVFNGPLTDKRQIIGYYITDASGRWWGYEPFEYPFVPINNGDSLTIVPVLSAKSMFKE